MSVTSEEAALEFREGDYGDRLGASSQGGSRRSPTTSGTAARSSCCGRGRHPTSSSPPSSSACWPSSSGSACGRPSRRSSSATAWARWGRASCPPAGPSTASRRWCSTGHRSASSGNILPAGIMSITGGIGWFAVNSVSGTFALNSLTKLSTTVCLLIIVAVQVVVAFFGHNLVQAFERYAFPVLAVVFVIASVISLSKSHFGAAGGGGGLGAFLLTVATVYGYCAGWNPYAADYSRYMPRDTDSARSRCTPSSGCSCPRRSWRSWVPPRCRSWSPRTSARPTRSCSPCPPSSPS